MLLKHQVWLIYDTTVRNNTGLSSGMDINCWQFLNLAWSIGVTGDHTWQLQMTARRPSSTVMFLGTYGHDMVNIHSVDYVYRYKNIATDMSWYECLELIGLGAGTVTVHSEIHYTCNSAVEMTSIIRCRRDMWPTISIDNILLLTPRRSLYIR